MGKIYVGEWNKIELIPKNRNIYIIGDEIKGIEAAERISYADTVLYKFFFPWLTKLEPGTCTLILNNCFLSRKRHNLNYNCIRHYCKKIKPENIIIFSDYPFIDEKNDFLTLWDMIQIDPFSRIQSVDDIDFCNCYFNSKIEIKSETKIDFPEKIVAQYEIIKAEAIGDQRFRRSPDSPDMIPKHLLRWTEKQKAKFAKLKFDFLDSMKPEMNIAISQLPVDKYFFQKLKEKIELVKWFNQRGEK